LLIENTAEVVDFQKSNYTNDDLYSWIESSIRTLFYQTYTMAYDLAKRDEAAYILCRSAKSSQATIELLLLPILIKGSFLSFKAHCYARKSSLALWLLWHANSYKVATRVSTA
jgi:hypothetical protein